MDDEIQNRDADEISEQKRSDDHRTLVYWLANEDVYTSPYVRNWLKSTPPIEVADMLADIARNARPETISLGDMIMQGVLMMFTTSAIISEKSPSGRKAGTRAAILLANRKDFRSLPPLVRVFETRWFWAGKYQETIEKSLLHLLDGAADLPKIRQYARELRKLAEIIWDSGHRRRELSRSLTSLMLKILPCLALVGETPDLELLKSIASSRAATAHRKQVKDAAAALLTQAG